jgi:hypothetical protein
MMAAGLREAGCRDDDFVASENAFYALGVGGGDVEDYGCA